MHFVWLQKRAGCIKCTLATRGSKNRNPLKPIVLMYTKTQMALLIALIFWGCKTYEPMEFVSFNNVAVNGIANGNLLVSADAIFYNPNQLKAQLKAVDIYVIYQQDTLAQVAQVEKMPIASQAEFAVPLKVRVSLAKLQQGLLDNLASLFNERSVDLTFIGNIKATSHGFSQTIPVNYTQEITF